MTEYEVRVSAPIVGIPHGLRDQFLRVCVANGREFVFGFWFQGPHVHVDHDGLIVLLRHILSNHSGGVHSP